MSRIPKESMEEAIIAAEFLAVAAVILLCFPQAVAANGIVTIVDGSLLGGFIRAVLKSVWLLNPPERRTAILTKFKAGVKIGFTGVVWIAIGTAGAAVGGFVGSLFVQLVNFWATGSDHFEQAALLGLAIGAIWWLTANCIILMAKPSSLLTPSNPGSIYHWGLMASVALIAVKSVSDFKFEWADAGGLVIAITVALGGYFAMRTYAPLLTGRAVE